MSDASAAVVVWSPPQDLAARSMRMLSGEVLDGLGRAPRVVAEGEEAQVGTERREIPKRPQRLVAEEKITRPAPARPFGDDVVREIEHRPAIARAKRA